MKKLSFIIPVYNVEDYLHQCIDSILNQYTDEVEIILVDDGSTDKSGKICDEYKECNCDIKIIHKKNGGASSARNMGMQYATGKYIAFVDSDDYIAKNAIQKILDWTNDSTADLCFMNAKKHYYNGKNADIGDKLVRQNIINKSKDEVTSFLASRPRFSGSACSKVFNRSFLLENSLCFPNDRRVSEDLIFVLECIIKAEKFDYLDFDYYYYRQDRTNSTSSSNFYNQIIGIQDFISNATDLLTRNKIPNNKMCENLMSIVAYEYSIIVMLLNKVEVDENILDEINSYRWTMKYSKNNIVYLCGMIINLLGINVASKIFDFIYKIKKIIKIRG